MENVTSDDQRHAKDKRNPTRVTIYSAKYRLHHRIVICDSIKTKYPSEILHYTLISEEVTDLKP